MSSAKNSPISEEYPEEPLAQRLNDLTNACLGSVHTIQEVLSLKLETCQQMLATPEGSEELRKNLLNIVNGANGYFAELNMLWHLDPEARLLLEIANGSDLRIRENKIDTSSILGPATHCDISAHGEVESIVSEFRVELFGLGWFLDTHGKMPWVEISEELKARLLEQLKDMEKLTKAVSGAQMMRLFNEVKIENRKAMLHLQLLEASKQTLHVQPAGDEFAGYSQPRSKKNWLAVFKVLGVEMTDQTFKNRRDAGDYREHKSTKSRPAAKRIRLLLADLPPAYTESLCPETQQSSD